MRTKVIDFLNALPAFPVEQHNQALQLYIQTPGHNLSVARYHNSSGYSEQRLQELLYDLKAAHNIKPEDLSPAPVQEAPASGNAGSTKGQITMPEFSKGPQGNRERKEFVAKHNLTAASNKNADLDAAILEFVAAQNKPKLDVLLGSSPEDKIETLTQEQVNSMDLKGPEFTEEEKKSSEAFDKILEILRKGEEVPASLVKELYAHQELTDDRVAEILEDARIFIADSKDIDVSGVEQETGGVSEGAQESTDDSKNDTDVSKNETNVQETQTSKEPSTEKK